MKTGIVVPRGRTAVQLAKRINRVVFNKPGTLTKGTPKVEREQIFRGDGRFLKGSSLFEQRLVHSVLLTSLYVESHDELKILEWWRLQEAE